ncbi:MAG: DUF4920 domain-containing protein [Bacteroidia bacterium]|nr:DUF4920 domain-containing protein [Bacteroidia bacterium]
MKKIVLFLTVALLAVACSSNKDLTHFGEKIKESGAVASSEIPAMMAGKDSMEVKVQGPVTSVCQVKGCWMKMDLGQDQTMMVRFKDYGFFVPKDASGKTAVAEGWAYRQVIPVEELRHYAEDAGKSQDEIMAITEPQEQLTFLAKGVILK